MIFVNLLNSTLKIDPNHRRKLYDLESYIDIGMENQKYLDIDIMLRLDSSVMIEEEGIIEMFSEMIFILTLVFIIIPLTVFLVSRKVKKTQEQLTQRRN